MGIDSILRKISSGASAVYTSYLERQSTYHRRFSVTDRERTTNVHRCWLRRLDLEANRFPAPERNHVGHCRQTSTTKQPLQDRKLGIWWLVCGRPAGCVLG